MKQLFPIQLLGCKPRLQKFDLCLALPSVPSSRSSLARALTRLAIIPSSKVFTSTLGRGTCGTPHKVRENIGEAPTPLCSG